MRADYGFRVLLYTFIDFMLRVDDKTETKREVSIISVHLSSFLRTLFQIWRQIKKTHEMSKLHM